jgi:hypothetical protein
VASELTEEHASSFFRFKHLSSNSKLKLLIAGRPVMTTYTQQENQTVKDTQAYSNITYIYSDAPKSRVLLEKLAGSRLVKKFSVFYRTQMFITAFIRARHLSLSWARSIQSMRPITPPEDQF